jgi:hypothetical protein
MYVRFTPPIEIVRLLLPAVSVELLQLDVPPPPPPAADPPRPAVAPAFPPEPLAPPSSATSRSTAAGGRASAAGGRASAAGRRSSAAGGRASAATVRVASAGAPLVGRSCEPTDRVSARAGIAAARVPDAARARARGTAGSRGARPAHRACGSG